ncbi:MAG: hypothetical protein AB7H80_15545 [Candidatus Kapaibacterium sp.]
MNYSELLHDFVENSLSTQHEETLFQALAVDEELRFELKYLLTLRDTIREDEEAGFVPLATTDSIFRTLGYTAPIAVGAGGGVAASQIGLISLIKTWGGYLVASLVGTLLATSVFLMVDDKREIVYADRGTTATENSVEASPSVTPPTQAANSASIETDGVQERITPSASRGVQQGAHTEPLRNQGTSRSTERQITKTTQSTERSKTSSATTPEVPSLSAESTSVDPVANTALTTSDSKSADTQESRNDNREVVANTIAPIYETDNITEPRSSASRSVEKVDNSVHDPVNYIKQQPAPFSAHVRGITVPVDLKTSKLQLPVADPGLENFALGISYPLNPNFSVVLEGGKESYLLSFTTPKDDGRVFLHEVQPSLIWGGVGLRYNLLTTSSFTPFSQLMIGGSTDAGLMGRGMIGANWGLTNNIGLTAGVEYSLVGYRYLGDLNFSDRLGLTYGLTIDFGR